MQRNTREFTDHSAQLGDLKYNTARPTRWRDVLTAVADVEDDMMKRLKRDNGLRIAEA